jgi:DNA-binding NarL/FixJ family response regulator
MISKQPTISVVILSMYSDESYVMRALEAGARAYLLKDSAVTDLIRAIEAVSQGKSFFSPKISRILAEEYVHALKQKGGADSYDLLTPREREILQLLAEGKTNKEVATSLNISVYTAETHRGNILQKLNLHSSAELVLYAVRKGIIS